MLDDFACQFYTIKNDKERGGKGDDKRNRIKKRLDREGEKRVKRSIGEQKEMKITCSTNVLAGFMLGLKSDCKFRRIPAMDTEKNRKSHTHVNIS